MRESRGTPPDTRCYTPRRAQRGRSTSGDVIKSQFILVSCLGNYLTSPSFFPSQTTILITTIAKIPLTVLPINSHIKKS